MPSTKSLFEAAQEVLNASRSGAAREPMHDLQSERGAQPAGAVRDLGGATYDDPSGGDIATNGANAMGRATPPGVQPGSDKEEAMHDLEKERGKQPGTSMGSPKTSPAGEGDGPGQKATGGPMTGTEFMHPTIGEEAELTEEEIAEAKAERMEKAKEKMKKCSMKEDVDAIFAGETLSAEFKTKLTTIFEAAVVTRALMVVEEMEDEIITAAQETVDEIHDELEEQVNDYMTYAVEEWKKENAVAIESGLRTEMTKEFITGLRNLFQEHYIDVPEEEVNVVESLSAKVDELSENLNTVMQTNIELTKKLNESAKKNVLVSVCEGLTATQSEKVKTLAEGVEFVSVDDYASKLKIIRENYFKASTTVKTGTTASTVQLTESADQPVAGEKEVTHSEPQMAAYARALSVTKPL